VLFFVTPERMEIGDLPMTTTAGKPIGGEALKFHRCALQHYGIATQLYAFRAHPTTPQSRAPPERPGARYVRKSSADNKTSFPWPWFCL